MKRYLVMILILAGTGYIALGQGLQAVQAHQIKLQQTLDN